MKKIKNLFVVMLLTLTIGVIGVDAKTYTSYKRGDKISVNVNETTTIDFYVVEDSDSNSTIVNAITQNFINENTYNYEEAKNLITSTEASWKNVNSVIMPSAKVLLNEKVLFDNEYSSNTYTEPTWVSPNTKSFTEYWLSESTFTDMQAIIYGMDTYYNSQFHLSQRNINEEIYVKALIEVSKDNIVGGTYISEDETLWNNYVEKFKNTSFVKELIDSGKTISITSTENTLKVELNDGTNSYVTNFTYSNGILKYVVNSDENSALIDSIWISNSIMALSNLKGYDEEKVLKYLENSKDLTLEKNGVSYSSHKITQEESNEVVSVSVSGEIFTSFELDIKNGLTNFNQKVENTTVKNPKTGINFGIGILTILLIGSVITYILIIKKSKFPQVK